MSEEQRANRVAPDDPLWRLNEWEHQYTASLDAGIGSFLTAIPLLLGAFFLLAREIWNRVDVAEHAFGWFLTFILCLMAGIIVLAMASGFVLSHWKSSAPSYPDLGKDLREELERCLVANRKSNHVRRADRSRATTSVIIAFCTLLLAGFSVFRIRALVEEASGAQPSDPPTEIEAGDDNR